jgi:hypothetical protein
MAYQSSDYEGFRQQLILIGSSHQDHQWAIPAAGGLAGIIAWTVSFPLDCVQAGVQGYHVVVGC